jgi:hypothetical protein
VEAEDRPGVEAFELSRQNRRGVRQASAGLEEALARPAGHNPKVWSADTADCLRALLDAFEMHVRHSEGPDGLLAEIVTAAPRLANWVDQIKRDHQTILSDIGRIESAAAGNEDIEKIEGIREKALDLLQALAAHRQRGADLIYEAYSVDIEAGD